MTLRVDLKIRTPRLRTNTLINDVQWLTNRRTTIGPTSSMRPYGPFVVGGSRPRTVIAGDTAEERLNAWFKHFQTEVYRKTTTDDGEEVAVEFIFGEGVTNLYNTGVI